MYLRPSLFPQFRTFMFLPVVEGFCIYFPNSWFPSPAPLWEGLSGRRERKEVNLPKKSWSFYLLLLSLGGDGGVRSSTLFLINMRVALIASPLAALPAPAPPPPPVWFGLCYGKGVWGCPAIIVSETGFEQLPFQVCTRVASLHGAQDPLSPLAVFLGRRLGGNLWVGSFVF